MRRSIHQILSNTLVLSLLTAASIPLMPLAEARSKVASCPDCATVVTTNRKTIKKEGSGTTGTVVGGLGGAVAGNVIGGDTTSTVLGGAGGALAGNLIGKRLGTKKIWSVQVRRNNGRIENIDYDTDPEFHQGDKVRIVDGRLERR